MRTSAALLLLLLLLLPRVRAASPDAVTRGDFVVLLWESAGAVPGDAAQGFSDVHRDDPCSTAVGWAAERRLVLGTGGGRFEPDRPITWEEAAVLLRRWAALQGRDTTLPTGWAAERRLVLGTGGGRFEPDRPITWEEAAVLLRRWAALQGRDTTLPTGAAGCIGCPQPSPWADDALCWAADTGLLDRSPDSRLDPGGTLTSAEAADLFHRFCCEQP